MDLTPGTYPVALNVTAGHGTSTPLQPGQVSYITTGAPIPEGATAVVKIEDTTPNPAAAANATTTTVQIHVPSTTGKWIRAIGSDVRAGSIVLHKGTRLGPAEIALLASVGQSSVPLYKRPTVGVMSTGDELVDAASTAPGNWKIRDSNRPMLIAAAKSAGAEVLDLGIAPDEENQLRLAMQQAMEKVDILVTSGGVSMGSHDLVKPLLEQMPGSTLHFGRVRMKPGKPTTFASFTKSRSGTSDQSDKSGRTNNAVDTLFFALPGNPVSSLVAFQLFVEPSIRKLLGCAITDCHHSRVQVRLTRALTIDPVRREYHRAALEWKEDSPGKGGCGEFHASSTGLQRSSRLLSMVTASALLCLPRATGSRRSLPAGSVVPALLLNRNVVPPPSTLIEHTYSDVGSGNASSTTVAGTGTGTGPNEANQRNELEELEPTCPCCRAAGRSPNQKKSNKPPAVLFGGSSSVGGDAARVGVLTVSDRAYTGQYEDRGGPEVLRCIHTQVQSTWNSESRVVPDEQRGIENALIDLCDRRGCCLVITTGGTGPSLRDVTPEATVNVCDRMFPGFGERMRAISMQHVPTAMLSRQTAGLRGSSFIINLPGNPGSIEQILPHIMSSIAHCIHLAGGPRMVVAVPKVGGGGSGGGGGSSGGGVPVVETIKTAVYTVDGANVIWLEKLMGKNSSGETKTEGLVVAATNRTMTEVVVQLLNHVRVVPDQKHVFTKKRGCGRVKSKKQIELSIDGPLLNYLNNAVKNYDLPDVGKCLRIVLDYVMEDDGVEEIVFGGR